MEERPTGMRSLPLTEKKGGTNRLIQSSPDIPTKEELEICFHLPNGETLTMMENGGIEIGHLKLKLSKLLGKPYQKISLTYNNMSMMDPLSIIDVIKMASLEKIHIEVGYSD
ncbi:conserved Plasmodium protein, unknown function [Plasmodium knowlesi strain H]|uniref:Ubiquitin-like domain-containing protein n=3 Tax=Plasmodium knowlesi TaxID=5850 RepID=A0A5K1VKV3_PLAKH|nr:conserved Plasmodium protein, unknown function [Plasmodium knowlesi strain H]OTN68779.1 Uncharacterized protein PKNOH_S01014900 [Plasmodium knowlesi]CAA9986146.1 conserved Plasmodium protein, unknown function [Plasmodium knowlesi strain H]SBO25329.1 conserved Plasmodium protein, unknown function [Plasmodium knowlesi strain H]SBO27641.1 conserved Plasmodium protein, unknown function [Plasmodium knowlesi strain H]VVS75620.1 conserved Plasmodium protein, unknown function [Plasmodium knowlesi s|eukprot:XP_002257558.1 hypothetical protein, conserved in Plasmodium species [Plasmodium knowlesi strain H]